MEAASAAEFKAVRSSVLASGLGPQAHEVPFGVAERRDPQAALGTSRARNRSPVSLHVTKCHVEILDVHERKDAGLIRSGLANDEMSNHVAGRVGERRLIAVAARLPTEHRLIEVSRAGGFAARHV
jgi:hypothetical protein